MQHTWSYEHSEFIYACQKWDLTKSKAWFKMYFFNWLTNLSPPEENLFEGNAYKVNLIIWVRA